MKSSRFRWIQICRRSHYNSLAITWHNIMYLYCPHVGGAVSNPSPPLDTAWWKIITRYILRSSWNSYAEKPTTPRKGSRKLILIYGEHNWWHYSSLRVLFQPQTKISLNALGDGHKCQNCHSKILVFCRAKMMLLFELNLLP